MGTVRSAPAKPVTASLKVKVTSEVSPTAKAVSLTTMLAVGRRVSTAYEFEAVVPVPGLPPATVLTPLLFSTTVLLLASTLAAGVRVAVQTVPPSLLLGAVTPPLATVRSDTSRPLTASLKVNVTAEVSPTIRLVSATTMVTVAFEVCTSYAFDCVLPVPVLPAPSL